MEEEGSLAGDEGGSNSWFPTPSLVNSREEVASLVAPTPSPVNSREEVASLVAQQQRDSWRKAKDLFDPHSPGN